MRIKQSSPPEPRNVCEMGVLKGYVISAGWFLGRFSVSNIFYKFITTWEGIGRFLGLLRIVFPF